MLNIKEIRSRPDILVQSLQKRGYSLESVEKIRSDFVQLYDQRLSILHTLEELRKQSNSFATMDKKERDVAIPKFRQEIQRCKKEFLDIDTRLSDFLDYLPNFLHPSVPLGQSEKDNLIIRECLTHKKEISNPQYHWTLGENLSILNFSASRKISGSRFSLLQGKGAQLERALINFMLDQHINKNGYVEIFAPYLVNYTSIRGTGQLPKFKDEIFITNNDMYLIPTAEVTLTGIHQGEILKQSTLPKKYVSYSACFRKEAGSYGKDTKGLMRNHQFNKIELVWISRPEESLNDLEVLTSHAEGILKMLKIPYRIVLLCSGDVGFASFKTYDLEVWMPGEKRWREISSCSCFTDFQSRRLNIRTKNSVGKNNYVHTINGSGVAVGRLFATILENYQQDDGSIEIPEALHDYCNFVKIEN